MGWGNGDDTNRDPRIEDLVTELARRINQQRAIAVIGTRALEMRDLAVVLDQAARIVAETLGVGFTKILELRPDGQLWLRAGTGWPNDAVGNVVLHDWERSMAGFALHSDTPVMVDDLRHETRFALSSLCREHGIVSGATVVIHGPRQPHGVLGVYSSLPRAFSVDDLHFLQAVANVLGSVIERQNAEEALHESNRQFEVTLAELRSTQQQVVQQERMRALGQMASGIAHDFNNALAMVMGYAELALLHAEDYPLPDKLRSYLKEIRASSADASTIVGRLRDFYRSRDEDDTFAPIDLTEVIAQSIALTQPRWKDQTQALGVTIHVQTEVADLPPILGNEAEIRAVLTNLIFNAVDALPSGGTLTIRAQREERPPLGMSDDPEWSLTPPFALLEVRDNGIGMTDDVCQRCLEPFFTTKGEAGTGLGLAMVHGIVRRHNGQISVASAPNQGTTFTIHLPFASPNAPIDGSPDVTANQPRQLRILVVDDEASLREIVAGYLEIDGHHVDLASDGPEALTHFRSKRFDLVITDRAMPEMNGDQLAAAIKHHAPDVPVILLTGFGELMTAAGEQPPGVDLILGKPACIAELRRAITTLTIPSVLK